ncbi:MAG: ribonuclease P protein component [Bacteroidota bacterium]|nr:ribonuclease P protein component [Bacteroidota bacterium]MDP4229951.1 ribonuclease P protein component [Bacteroidota bacterium]MDP4235636.1 ribonuclease P protein component [Bacteroidota bacterium]
MKNDALTIDRPAVNLLPMMRLQKDIDELFARRKWLVRSLRETNMLSSLFFFRRLEENAEPLLLLLHAPKRIARYAHERNKLKRRIREALRQSEEIREAVRELSGNKMQVLLLVRSDFNPSKDHGWPEIQEDISLLGIKLLEKIQKAKNKIGSPESV